MQTLQSKASKSQHHVAEQERDGRSELVRLPEGGGPAATAGRKHHHLVADRIGEDASCRVRGQEAPGDHCQRQGGRPGQHGKRDSDLKTGGTTQQDSPDETVAAVVQVHLVEQHYKNEFKPHLGRDYDLVAVSGDSEEKDFFGRVVQDADVVICTAQILHNAMTATEEAKHIELSGEWTHTPTQPPDPKLAACHTNNVYL